MARALMLTGGDAQDGGDRDHPFVLRAGAGNFRSAAPKPLTDLLLRIKTILRYKTYAGCGVARGFSKHRQVRVRAPAWHW
jgi:hypothetical protein